MPIPSVSLVIPHYSGAIIFECLDSVLAQVGTFAFEIIVVVDQKPEGPAKAILQERFPQISVLFTGGGAGYAASCNLGAKVARADYVAILNDDVIVTPEWLTPLVEFLDAHNEVAICAPKLRSLSKPELFDNTGAAGGFFDLLGFPFARGRIFESIETDRGQYDSEMNIFWVSGCAMLIRKGALERVGFFDERFFMQMEEIDLCWRLRLLGEEIFVCPKSVVYHYGGYSLHSGSLKKDYLNHRNNLVLLLKNLSLGNLLWIFPLRLLILLCSVLLILIRPKEWRHIVASLGALAWITCCFPLLLPSRKGIQKSRKMTDKQALAFWYRRSILWDYLVLGKSRISDLPQLFGAAPIHSLPL